MSVINRLPIGGGASDDDSIAGIKVYSQISEPAKKDGIWIKTNGSVDNILLTNDIFTRTLTKTITDGYTEPYEHEYTVYNNEIYMRIQDHGNNNYYITKFNGTAFTRVLSDDRENNIWYGNIMSYGDKMYIVWHDSHNSNSYGWVSTTTDFKTFTTIGGSELLCIYNNDLYIKSYSSDHYSEAISTLQNPFSRFKFSNIYGSPVHVINGMGLYNYDVQSGDAFNDKLLPISVFNLPMGYIKNCIGGKYYIMNQYDMQEYTLNLKSTVNPNTLILYEYGNNGRNQINLYTDKYENLKLGFNRAFYYGQSGMVWNVEIYVPYDNKWLKIQSY